MTDDAGPAQLQVGPPDPVWVAFFRKLFVLVDDIKAKEKAQALACDEQPIAPGPIIDGPVTIQLRDIGDLTPSE